MTRVIIKSCMYTRVRVENYEQGKTEIRKKGQRLTGGHVNLRRDSVLQRTIDSAIHTL